MLTQIQGLHHVTSLASGARQNNAFFTETLGLRRVKKTVNFDAPDVYHLYYADGAGSPGSVMTYFPFPHAAPGRRGTGETSETAFAIPSGQAGAWAARLADAGVARVTPDSRFGETRLGFNGPDGERFALVETAGDTRAPWSGGAVPSGMAIRGFHGVTLRVADAAPTRDLLLFMGYAVAGAEGAITRMQRAGGNGADFVDIHAGPGPEAEQGAGSVHHVAFSVADRAAQTEVQEALRAAGHQVTAQIDRDYFWAIYFRTPGGILFEVATDEPGFATDEPAETMGSDLMLPEQHAHLRSRLEATLAPLD